MKEKQQGPMVVDLDDVGLGDLIVAYHVVTSTPPLIPAGWTAISAWRPPARQGAEDDDEWTNREGMPEFNGAFR